MFDTIVANDADPAALIATVAASHRLESILVARRLAAVAALLRQRVRAAEQTSTRPGYAVIDAFEHTAAEIAAVLNLSAMAASYLVSHAEALDVRLPQIAALLAQGKTDWRTVRLIINRTDLVTDKQLMAKLDHALAQRIGTWQSWSRQRIINTVDAAVRVADPDAARERRQRAEADRHIQISATDNGMAEIYGTVAATAATAFDQRLNAIANHVCRHDPRNMAQRRADALTALATDQRLTCTCGNPQCPNTTQANPIQPSSGQIVINVIAHEQTIIGTQSPPGYLQGYGVIDAEQIRQLTQNASVFAISTPPTSTHQAQQYHPSTAVERAVRCRDLTCRFPGCSRPATQCDLDHTIPFNHINPVAGGLTVLENLKCLCRSHHRMKTFGGWHDIQLPDGTVIWTSPTGQKYHTTPAGTDLFPQLTTPTPTPPTTHRPSHAQQRATRINQARKHNREQRPINETRRHINQARIQEIAARKFRNHLRDMLFLLKGTPSTSPICTWVNQPREPEELPADWQPPPPSALPDSPPF